MSKRNLMIVILILMLHAAASAQGMRAGTPRVKVSLNSGWLFHKGDVNGGASVDLDDAGWQRVDLPHTWNVQDPFDEEPGYYRGAGWYRRDLSIAPPDMAGKRLFLYFEGANQKAEVFVNGRPACKHAGGYTAFACEVTELIKPNATNKIAVRVDNSFDADVPPLTADFNFYGGIYRDVWLVATGEIHFAVTDHASPGVTITTPRIAEGVSTINVRGTIESSAAGGMAEVGTRVLDPSKRVVSSAVSKVDITARSGSTFSQDLPAVRNARSWSPDDPFLYTVEITIRYNGRAVDRVTQPLGFRWYKFDAATGFSINGRPVKLRGTNRHQDHEGLGNAVPDRLQVRDMELIKATGFNFVRLAHYPQDPAVLDAADRLGLLIWEEIPLVNYITNSAEFKANSQSMLLDMIRQHRNHPSVILWGYMNEIYLRVPKGADELYPATVELARELNRLAHSEDATRPTTIALHQSERYNETGLADVPDVVGWNIYQGWYSGNIAAFGEFIDDQHRRYPRRPLIISEYGANSDLRLHSLEPRRFDSTAEYQRQFHESYLDQIDARPFVAGSTLWNEFDFGSEFRGDTIPHINQKGMFTFDRRPKDVNYFYAARLSPKPVVHIATRDWPKRAGRPGTAYDIELYTNQSPVELLLNGASLGEQAVGASRKVVFRTPLRPGQNYLLARTTTGRRAVSDSAAIDFTPIDANSREIRINVGSNADFIDGRGNTWIADHAYAREIGWGFVGADSKYVYSSSGDHDVLGTEDDPLYQTMQEGLTGYRVDVPPGRYEVELLFAEMKIAEPGRRVFDVTANGRTVVSGIDLFSAAGIYRAHSVRFTTDVPFGGLLIGFNAKKGAAILSGLHIRRV